jgi:hypothetical protein
MSSMESATTANPPVMPGSIHKIFTAILHARAHLNGGVDVNDIAVNDLQYADDRAPRSGRAAPPSVQVAAAAARA